MTNRAQLKQAMYGLIEGAHLVSEITGVPVETLVVAMLAAAKRQDADALIEAAKFFAPFRKAPMAAEGTIVPTSARYQDFLSLIQRDNPHLYQKLAGLD
jgi:hypothetical protein